MPIPLAVFIPARCGSKRVPLKNIKPLAGRPLIHYTISAAIEAGLTEAVFVSTDCEEIAGVAVKCGAEVVMRPEQYARDESSTEDAMLDFIEQLGAQDQRPEWVMTLPPTSPLRTADTIVRAWKLALETPDEVDCLFSVHPTREDFWVGDTPGSIARLFPEAPRRQQDRKPLWVENSCIYLTRTAALVRTGFILGEKHSGFEISVEEGFDINSEADFIIAEQLFKNLAKETPKKTTSFQKMI
ncbi:MAG: acylneuraminate cytidylyltransferase family protein [Pseudomonadota bacterium]